MPLPIHRQRPLRDILDRPMSDLRISVTDRCNFRCTFCMPAEQKYDFLPRRELLSFEETARLARLFVGLGVRKIRITGGEPLLRTELEKLIAQLAALEGVGDLALTTNGYLLAEKAEILKAAGLDRVTVSFHSLDPAIFGRLNGLGMELEKVLDGLEQARRAGLGPIKLNVVPIEGVNDHEIVPIARWARDRGYVVRFIEYMDVGTVNGWNPDEVLSARKILERIDRQIPLEPVPPSRAGEVAQRYRYRDGSGEIGVISSVTEPFCGDCSRVRLSAEGKLFTCLFAASGTDLKEPLRQGASDGELVELVRGIWSRREDRYSEQRTEALKSGHFVPVEKVEMFRIGG